MVARKRGKKKELAEPHTAEVGTEDEQADVPQLDLPELAGTAEVELEPAAETAVPENEIGAAAADFDDVDDDTLDDDDQSEAESPAETVLAPGELGRIELERGPPPGQRDMDALYAQAKELGRSGDLEGAVAAYSRLLGRKPDHLKARNNLGYTYDQMGEPERALEQYRAAL